MSLWTCVIGWFRFTVPDATVDEIIALIGGEWIKDQKGFHARITQRLDLIVPWRWAVRCFAKGRDRNRPSPRGHAPSGHHRI